MSAFLFFAYCVSLVLATNHTRNYTVGIKVSTVWYSGSSDVMYFQICNDDLAITNTSAIQDPCLNWYEMSGGLANRGEWYYFDYPEQPDIGSITSMKLLSQLNDQFCLSKVSIDGVVYDDSNVDCVEVSDTKPALSCSVIDITFGNEATFTGTLYEAPDCPYDVSSSYSGPPVTTANGTRTYELSLTVSSVFFSGTNNDLYLRLCTDFDRTDCTKSCNDAMTDCSQDDWFVFAGGVREEGNTYKGYWNTMDIGNVHYADIVIYGADQFCLSRLGVDAVTADANTAKCISDETSKGCATIKIGLDAPTFDTSETDPCNHGIMSNATFLGVEEYVFTFKTGSSPFCGADATIYFIFCAVDGGTGNTDYCSKIYEIGGQMPEKETDYSFTIDVSDYGMFNTLSDVFFVDVWEYATEMWCLSDITIDGITEDGDTVEGPNADSGTPALVMESDVDDGVYCNGVRVYMQTNEWEEFFDGPMKKYKIKKCRWNDLKAEEGTEEVSRSNDKQDWLDWMNDGFNWVYIAAGLVGLTVCCICFCWWMQRMRSKQDAEVKNANKPWHGGNSAFYS